MSSIEIPTGEFTIIVPKAKPHEREPNTEAPPGRPPRRRHPFGHVAIGTGTTASVLLASLLTSIPQLWRILAVDIAIALLVLCGVAVLQTLRVRVDDERAREIELAMAVQLQEVRASLVRHVDANRDDIRQRLAQLAEVRELVEGRLAELGQRVDLVDETLKQVATAASIVATASANGQVHQLRPR